METIVITGANRGIGFELTKIFLNTNRKVIATFRDESNSQELINLKNNKNLETHKLELGNQDSINSFLASLSNRKIDILINNAGIMRRDGNTYQEMNYDDWIESFNINTIAPFKISTGLLSNLKQSENPRIIAISSQMGALSRKREGCFAYRSSKAALNKVMQTLSAELATDNIIVCPVHPGWVQTSMGGEGAQISAKVSASGIANLIDSLKINDSGKFFTWEGEEHLW